MSEGAHGSEPQPAASASPADAEGTEAGTEMPSFSCQVAREKNICLHLTTWCTAVFAFLFYSNCFVRVFLEAIYKH